MACLRYFFTASAVTQTFRDKLLKFPTSSYCQFDRRCLPKTLCSSFSSSLVNNERRNSIESYEPKNAFDWIRIAERNRLNLRLMSQEQQKAYFDDLWEKIIADKGVRVPTVSRFLHLKREFGQEVSYESSLANLRELGLKPDAMFFSVFIRKSCEKGDMEETSHYLKAMHQEGAVPNDYIFSKILHGYVKCGLPDEVAVTQDVMSKLNYWPSMMATEDLLMAYADLGDENSVVEILQEALHKSDSILDRPVFPPQFLADLYFSLTMAIQSESDGQAFSMILDLLKKRPPHFDDFRLGNALTRLLQAGKFDSAFRFLRSTRPLNFSVYYLSKIPEILAGQDPKVLNDFWVASGTIGRLPEIIRSMTIENILRTVRANPPLNTVLYNTVANIAMVKAVKLNKIDLAVELGKILGNHRSHFLYLIAAPRLLTLGLKPQEILARFEPPLRSCAALGIVLNDLCSFSSFQNPPQSGKSLEDVKKLVDDYQKLGLLPFNDYISVNNDFIFLLLRGCNQYAKQGDKDLDTGKIEAWADSLFSCFLSERHPLLSNALLRFLGHFPHEVTSESLSPQFLSLDKQMRLSLAKAFVAYFDKRKIPISYLKLVKKSLKDIGMSDESLAGLLPAGNASKHSILVSKIQAGKIDEVIEELRKMQKSISQETSVLGSLGQYSADILSEAFAISTPATGTDVKEAPSMACFTPQQMEQLFWALIDNSGLKNPGLSVTKIGELYLNASDMDGLEAFLGRLADQYPQHLFDILSRRFINKFVELDGGRAGQIIEEVLQRPNVSLPIMALGAYNYEMGQTSLIDNINAIPQLGVKLLSQHIGAFNHLRKVRTVHNAIEELCQKRQIFAAYGLRDWACQLGLTLLPQTTETLLASSVFVDSIPRIPISFLAPERMTIRGGISLTRLIPQIREAINMINSAEMEDQATMTEAVNAVTRAVAEHPFVVDPSVLAHTVRPVVYKKMQFAFWSAVYQAIDSAGSRISMDANLARIASGLIAEGHEDAVLSWISCLLRTDKIAALCCGGLTSTKSSAKFIKLLERQPELQFAVATSPALAPLTPDQKLAVTKNFETINRSDLPTLAQVLFNKEFDQAKTIINELKDDAIPVLAGFVNCQPSFVPLVAEVLKDKSLDYKNAFVNRVLDGTQTHKTPLRMIFDLLEMAAKPNMLDEEKVDFGCLRERISMSNQVFLRALFKFRTNNRVLTAGFATGVDYLRSVFPDSSNAGLRDSLIQAIRLGKNQVIYESLVSIQKSDPSKLRDAAKSIIYSQLLATGHRNALTVLFSAAHDRNGELLENCLAAALPFLHNALGTALKGLVNIYRKVEVDPVIHEAISFHRLGELTVPTVPSGETPKIESLSLKFDRPTTSDVSDPVRLAKESVTRLAATLASNKLIFENVKVLVDVVRKLWGPGRIDLLLCHLVELQAGESVSQVIESLTPELHDRRIPFKTLCSLLKLNTSGEAATSGEQFARLVEDLKTSSPQSLTLCMNGPHVFALFSSWPESHINEALDVIDNTLDRFQPLLRLQLAAALVHRGLADKASSIVEKTGPIPFNYLAGSLTHPLTKSAYHHSFRYLKATDPEHVATFVDASLRNAALSDRSSASSEAVVELLRAAIEESPAELKSYCQPSTLRILNKATKDCEEIHQALFMEAESDSEH